MDEQNIHAWNWMVVVGVKGCHKIKATKLTSANIGRYINKHGEAQ